jgi:mRNA interferase YafQ
MNQLKEAMMLLIANNGPLGPEWLDHPLTGNWEGHRECHIGGDFLWPTSSTTPPNRD